MARRTTARTGSTRLALALLVALLGLVPAWAMADGELDTTFGAPNGYVITDLEGDDYGYAVAIQSDGKIVVAGRSGGDLAVARYNTDGSLDTAGFGAPNGYVTTDLGGSETGLAVALQPNDQIVLAGYSFLGGVDIDFAVARYNTDGSLDTAGFGAPNGYVTTSLSIVDECYAMALQPNGQIVLAGHSLLGGEDTDFAVLRYNTDGSLDTAGFGAPNGYVTTDLGGWDSGSDLKIQPNGQIVVGGSSSTHAPEPSPSNFALARYNSDGSLDTAGFGAPNGYVITNLSSMDNGYTVALQPNGQIVLAGFSLVNDYDVDFAVLRYNTDGSLDTAGFGAPNGYVITDLGSDDDMISAVAIQSDGKIVATGSNNGNVPVARYNADGSLDTTNFGAPNGYVLTDLGGSETGRAVAFQGSKIVVAGYGAFTDYDLAVIRYQNSMPVPGVDLSPDRASAVSPGAIVVYDHTLTNTGDNTDTFDVTYSSSQGWAQMEPAQVTLDAGISATVRVTVTVPGGVVSVTVDTTVVTATSQADSGVWATVTDTTTAGGYHLFLPLVSKNY